MQYSLGIHFEKQAIHIALLSKQGQKVQIECLRSFPADEDVKPLYILRSILEGKEVGVATGLQPEEVILRPIDLKLKRQREIRAALPFQIETLLPLDPQETAALPFLAHKYFLAASQSSIQRHIYMARHHDIEPDRVSCAPVALWRVARFLFPEHVSFNLIVKAEDKWVGLSVEEGDLLFCQTIGDLDRLQAYFKEKKVDHLPFVQIPPDYADQAMALGFALDLLAQDQQTADWRTGPFSSPQIAKRELKALWKVTGASLLLAATVWLGGIGYLRLRSHQLIRGLEKQGIEASRPLEAQLQQWKQSLVQKKTSSAFHLSAPTVSEILAWISTHPQLKDTEIRSLSTQLVKDHIQLTLECIAPSPDAAQELCKIFQGRSEQNLCHLSLLL